jgi:hypothetical protein
MTCFFVTDPAHACMLVASLPQAKVCMPLLFYPVPTLKTLTLFDLWRLRAMCVLRLPCVYLQAAGVG